MATKDRQADDLKVYGTMWFPRGGRAERVVMAGPKRLFEEATGIGADWISDTGNDKEVAAARKHPEELIAFPEADSGNREVWRIVPREEWSWRHQEAEKRRANSVTAAQVRVLARVRDGKEKSSGLDARGKKSVERLLSLGLLERKPLGVLVTHLGNEVIDRIGSRKSVDVRAVAKEAERERRRESYEANLQTQGRIEDARRAVVDAAKAASRQEGSIDAVFEAVDRLEGLEREAGHNEDGDLRSSP